MRNNDNYNGPKGILKFIATAISWSVLVCLIIVASFLAYYLISTKIYEQKGERFEPFIALYNVLTISMLPNIEPQDVVVTLKVKEPDDIKVGDIITFYSTASISRGMIITHRVVDIVETEEGIGYKTKGDNNTAPDTAPAEFDNVIGKVIIKIPNLGYIQNILASKAGWLIIIVIPALFIIISDIVKLFHLNDIKRKITTIEQENNNKKELKKQQEEIRKNNLKKKLKIEKSIYEPDPLPVKKPTRIVVGETFIVSNDDEDYAKKNKKKNKKNKKQ